MKFHSALAVTALAAASVFATFESFTEYDDNSLRPQSQGGPHKLTISGKQNYLKSKFVVDSGCTLIILPGTWFYGTAAAVANTDPSVLVVAPGGYIDAQGTATDPIVFTAYGDDFKDPEALGPGAKGLWGGVIFGGFAPNSFPGYRAKYMEGMVPGDARLYHGGSNPNDNSGIFRYVSIRHAGAALATASEINGLTLYSVGAGTTIENVEIFANYDDGFEWFGGTVNHKYLVTSFCLDDHFDLDDGYRGKNQFWFSLMDEYEGDNGGEWDGCQAGQTLYSAPTVYNFTFVGSGVNASNKKRCLYMADTLGGFYANGIITQHNGSEVIRRAKHNHYWAREFGAGLDIKNCIFWGVKGSLNAPTWNDIVNPASDIPYISANNQIVDPQLVNVVRGSPVGANNGPDFWRLRIDPRPVKNSPAMSGGLLPPNDGFFSQVTYRGAFDTSSTTWIDGWTALSQKGIIASRVTSPRLDISPASGSNWPATWQLPLQMVVKNAVPGEVILTSSPLFKVMANGVDVTSFFSANATLVPGMPAGTVTYLVTLSQAQFLVPGASGGNPVLPVKSPIGHVLTVSFPMGPAGGPATRVLTSSSRFFFN